MARTFQRARRRSVAWAHGPSAADLNLTSSTKVAWTGAIVGTAAALKRTIVRIRGGGQVILTSGTAIGDGFLIGLGIGLVTEQALTAGVASIPGPLTDIDWDGWMWHTVLDVRLVTATLSDGVNAAMASARFEVDTKAMRKWDEGAMAVVGVMEGIESGAGTVDMSCDTRMLLKQG